MHDLNYFRDHLDVFADMAKNRGAALDLDAFRKLDKERRELITATEQLKAQRNKASDEIAGLRKEKKNADSLVAKMKEVSEAGDFVAGFVALRFELLGSGDKFASLLVQLAKSVQIERGAAVLRHIGEDIQVVSEIVQVMHGGRRIP